MNLKRILYSTSTIAIIINASIIAQLAKDKEYPMAVGLSMLLSWVIGSACSHSNDS